MNKIVLAILTGVFAVCFIPFYILGINKLFKTGDKLQPESPADDNKPLPRDGEMQAPTAIEAVVEFKSEPSLSESLLQIADFHVTVKFNDSFAATVSVFKSQKLVKRRMRAISSASSTLMKNIWLADNWDMGNIALTGETTFERALLQTEEEGILMIREILDVKEPKYLSELDMFRDRFKLGQRNTAVPVVFDQAATTNALSVLRTGTPAKAVMGLQFTQPETPVVATAKSSDRRKAVETIEGRVVSAEERRINYGNADKPAAPVFEVTIVDSNSESHSKRGIRLQELFTLHGIKVGDCIKLECLGRTNVDSQDASPGSRPVTRNEFRIEKLATLGA